MEFKLNHDYGISFNLSLSNHALQKILETALIEQIKAKYPDVLPIGMIHLNRTTSHLALYNHFARDDYGYTDIVLPEKVQEIVNNFCDTIKFLS